MYNIAGHFDPKGLFKDWLLVGYATVYTMAPVFSLVLDRDVDDGCRLADISECELVAGCCVGG